jgi:P27 family predicted phage terminase small subunit
MGLRGPQPPLLATVLEEGNPHNRSKAQLQIGHQLDFDLVLEQTPEHLEGYALEFWQRHAPMLYRAGALTEADYAHLQITAESYKKWRELEDEFNSTGRQYVVYTVKGESKINPLLTAINFASKELTQNLQNFGMTPSSRTRIRLNTKERRGVSEKDHHAKFLEKRQKIKEKYGAVRQADLTAAADAAIEQGLGEDD